MKYLLQVPSDYGGKIDYHFESEEKLIEWIEESSMRASEMEIYELSRKVTFKKKRAYKIEIVSKK